MRKRFRASQSINLLRAIEVKSGAGMGTVEVCRSLGVSDKRQYRWPKLYGSMGRTEVKRCKDLGKMVLAFELDKRILKGGLDFLGPRV